MFTDTIGDMITRIRNGCMVRRKYVRVPHSQLRENVLQVLIRSGYIRGYDVFDLDAAKKEIRINLKYRDGVPVIKHLKRLSKPSCRRYSKLVALPKVFSGLGDLVISTSKGVMSSAEARAAGVGGEILFEVF